MTDIYAEITLPPNTVDVEVILNGFTDVDGLVPKTTKVNGHALSADVTITQGDVGLGNVDNTSDAGKPVSNAQQSALDLKANLISPSFTTPDIGNATGRSIVSTGSFDIQLDTDNNGTEYLNIKNGEGNVVAQITESGYILGNGFIQMLGGIAINTNMFNVDGANGDTTVAGSLTVVGPFYLSSRARIRDEGTGIVIVEFFDGANWGNPTIIANPNN